MTITTILGNGLRGFDAESTIALVSGVVGTALGLVMVILKYRNGQEYKSDPNVKAHLASVSKKQKPV